MMGVKQNYNKFISFDGMKTFDDFSINLKQTAKHWQEWTLFEVIFTVHEMQPQIS